MRVYIIILIAFISASAHADDCSCKDANDNALAKPIPTYDELKKDTERLKKLDTIRHEILNDRHYKTKKDKNDAFAECFRDGFADVARFVKVNDITDVSYDAYAPFAQSFFLRHSYETKDVLEVLKDTKTYKDLDEVRRNNPYKAAQQMPEIKAVGPCDFKKLTDNETAHSGIIGGYYNPKNNTVYYNKCGSFQSAVDFVAHELTHAFTRTQELDEHTADFKTLTGKGITVIKEGGLTPAIDKHYRLRYETEYQAYMSQARIDRELVRTYPGIAPMASGSACDDTTEWFKDWQRFEEIEGNGYPKTYGVVKLAEIHERIGCPLTEFERGILARRKR